MASSSDEEDVVGLLLLLEEERMKKRKHRFWVNPYNRQQPSHGTFIVSKELSQDPAKFQSLYRMTPSTFTKLSELVGPVIRKRDTNFRTAVCAEERLLITLRFLATGLSFKALHFDFMRGESSIGLIVGETTEAIWKILQQQYMPEPTVEKWMQIAVNFKEKFQFPNCIGSFGGKLVRVRCPQKGGSAYSSVVLVAVVDAGGLFTMISIEDYGQNSDSSVFCNSAIFKALKDNKLNIPPPEHLPTEEKQGKYPYVFVADEAFPLMEHIMRPYPQRGLTDEKRIFNARLSRARKAVECAFGKLSSNFRIFYTPICCRPEKVRTVIKAACVLHNFISMEENCVGDSAVEELPPCGKDLPKCKARPAGKPIANRNRLAQHFMKPKSTLP